MTVESWDASQYRAAIKVKLEEDFEEVDGELGKLPDFSRLDFDPAWVAGENAPGSADLFVFGIFVAEMGGDRSVYVFPKAAEPASKAWRRYTLSRVGAAPECEVMSRETFVSELAEEYSALIDPETCPKCGNDLEGDPDPDATDTIPPPGEAPAPGTAPATPAAKG